MRRFAFLFAILSFCLEALCAFQAPELNEAPIAYRGRFRPLEVYAKLWLEEDDPPSDPGNDSVEFIWGLHFLSPDTAPKLMLLPSRRVAGEWLPIDLLQTIDRLDNFTAYPKDKFQQIHDAYTALGQAMKAENSASATQLTLLARELGIGLLEGYRSLAGHVVKQSVASTVRYPSIWQLKAELWAYRLPLIPAAIGFYLMGAFLLVSRCATHRTALMTLGIGFTLHTMLLILRCVILARPPVSNMFETLIFVPWISMLTGWIWVRHPAVLIVSSLASVVMLVLLQMTGLSSEMENVQAVLDSHAWLIIHVLMIVSSYGVYLLCGFLGHAYLLSHLMKRRWDLEKAIHHTMYLGTALLIPGTILGGVWAAQSWGRFWDWDPKESWAFITACVYLIIIHAYRYQKIGAFGLALGSVMGLLAVSFTWYGVNYILGTGLHSYGFGAGGIAWYSLYFTLEVLFIAICWFCVKHTQNPRDEPKR